MMKICALVLCVAFVSAETPVEENGDDSVLPAGMITCQIDSPERDSCIKDLLNDLLPKLANGMGSFHFPPIDPYRIESQALSFRRGDAFAVTGRIRKTDVYGISQSKITDVKTNITKKHISLEARSYCPQSIVQGYYRAQGRFNNLKMKSKGYFNLTATDMHFVNQIEGDIIEVNGKEYLKLTKFDSSPKFGGLKIFASGLFPDPELSRITFRFINQHWPFIAREMMPGVRKTVEPVLIEMSKKLLLRIPIRQIFYYGKDSDQMRIAV